MMIIPNTIGGAIMYSGALLAGIFGPETVRDAYSAFNAGEKSDAAYELADKIDEEIGDKTGIGENYSDRFDTGITIASITAREEGTAQVYNRLDATDEAFLGFAVTVGGLSMAMVGYALATRGQNAAETAEQDAADDQPEPEQASDFPEDDSQS